MTGLAATETVAASKVGIWMRAPVRSVELLLYCLLGIGLLAGRLAVSSGPSVSNDGYQYVSVTRNFLEGRPAQTSIVHFDMERSWRRVPAPLTTFPSGYPFAASLVSRLGPSPERAALLISAVAFLGLLLLYALADRWLGLGGLATRFLIVWTLLNAQLVLVGTAVATEALFITVGFAAIVVFAAALRQPPGRQLLAFVAGNVLVGLSYWVRYAGLFWLAATGAAIGLLLVRRRDRTWLRAAAAFPVSLLIVGIGLWRNQRLVGTWKGGNDLAVHHPVKEILGQFAASVHHIFIGERARAFLVPELLFVFGVLALSFLSSRALLRRRSEDADPNPDLPFLIALYLGVYSAAMIYTGVNSDISFSPRMFYPLIPLFLLLGAWALSSVQRVGSASLAFALVLAATTAGYLVANLHHDLEAPPPAPHQLVQRELAAQVSPGVSLRAWIEGNIRPDETIVATRGQATGHVLGRKTVSLVAHEYSKQDWDQRTVRDLMETYRARFIILYADDRSDLEVTRESPFLTGLIRGVRPPWLTEAARTRDVLVLRAADVSARGSSP